MSSLLALLLACTPTPKGGPPGGTGPQEPRACVVQEDNALRIDCTLPLASEGALTVEVLRDGVVVRRFASAEPALEHHVTLWGLEAATTYTVRVTPDGRPELAWDEVATTGALPEVVQLAVERAGTPTVEHVLFPFQCGGPGHLVLVRASDGALVWYQDVTAGLSLGDNVKVDGFEFDPASGTVLALVGHLGAREFAFTGEVRREMGRLAGLPLPTHHDAHRHGDLAYALNAETTAEPDGVYVMDGVYVFDADGALAAEWSLRDHVAPTGGVVGGYWTFEYPGSIDYSHGNNVFVGEDGDWLLGFRALDTVMAVRGDLDAPDFGEILWTLTTAEGPFESDLEVISSAGITDDRTFSDQHHPTWDDDGLLLLFDNGRADEVSRGLALAVDVDAGTADIVDAWPLDEHCPVQGSIFRLPSGNVLLTCPMERTFYEFEPGGGEPISTMTVACEVVQERPLVVRGQPVSI